MESLYVCFSQASIAKIIDASKKGRNFLFSFSSFFLLSFRVFFRSFIMYSIQIYAGYKANNVVFLIGAYFPAIHFPLRCRVVTSPLRFLVAFSLHQSASYRGFTTSLYLLLVVLAFSQCCQPLGKTACYAKGVKLSNNELCQRGAEIRRRKSTYNAQLCSTLGLKRIFFSAGGMTHTVAFRLHPVFALTRGNKRKGSFDFLL